MEANKEGREVVEKKEKSETQGKKKNDGVDESAATKKSTTGLDPMTKTLIHKSIITDGNGGKEGGTADHHGAETRDDLAALLMSMPIITNDNHLYIAHVDSGYVCFEFISLSVWFYDQIYTTVFGIEIMKKSTTMLDFFKRKGSTSNSSEVNVKLPTTNVAIPIPENVDVPIPENVDVPILENVDVPISQTQFQRIDLDSLDYDPGTRKQIWEYHVNQRDEIRRAYIKKGPHQPPLGTFKKSGKRNHAAYCLPCFVFHNPNGVMGQQNAFIVGGFRSWKKVGGKDCYLQGHIGKDPNSAHRVAEQMCKDLMNQLQHLQRVVDHFTTEQIANNRLQLKASIFIVRYLAFQAIAFRGNDESFSSLNRVNFFESLGIVTFFNEKIAKIIEKAPKNATYTSPRIQKEILHVFSAKVKKAIWEEIGDAKFCIMVDEARDESIKEQMAVVFRYVDVEGFVKERFFGLIHVVDTAALTLKKGIYSLLSQHCFDIQNIRGQGYDGASNIIVNASCKRNEQLKVANANEIARLIDLEELETGSGLNQIGTLQRPVETRWSSHFRSVSSLLRMFTSTVEVLQNIIDDAIDGEHRAEAEAAYDGLTSFEFVFILHLEKETMEITDKLCQALQS
ncbi:uncharacterized protein LOC112024383 [Quercus suber]|uniref:uncharacterized protein LOC112024383 n=1 Tax=Quercus suber TaxID=58331 RepID=UPI0032DEFC26